VEVTMNRLTGAHTTGIATALGVLLGIWTAMAGPVHAQGKVAPDVGTPQFKYDPFWPKPLPEGWVLGAVGSVCVDAQDHVFVVTRGVPDIKEKGLATPAPPVLEFDDQGNLVRSWGNRDTMAKTQHGCFIDMDGNFWTAGNNDGIVQKYTHD